MAKTTAKLAKTAKVCVGQSEIYNRQSEIVSNRGILDS